MSANVVSSSNGTAAATVSDTTFTVTKEVRNTKDGIFLFLKYTIGSSSGLTITFATKSKNNSLTDTDAYSIIQLSGSAISALSYNISASGNYKIPIPLCLFDDTLVVTIVFTTTGGTGIVVADIMEA
jgi:hypothetical protein